jgi:Tfp pilus tip-associated adhesin PilY1
VLWEFTDTTDQDTNCEEGFSGDECAPWWDLGWTWSKPVIARIAIYNSGTQNEPDDIFVAFFGGGWDETGLDRTGRHFYGINVETGEVIVKHPIGVAVPGSPTALDTDDDGFHDRIYFADSNGSIWRLQYPAPTSSSATGAEAGDVSDPGTFTRIWDFRTSFADRQMFFHRPVAASTVVEGGSKVWALALGSGNRADLGELDDGVNHFFFVLDMGDEVTRDANSLLPVDYTELDGSYTCATNALDPAAGLYGWYLAFRPNEKVMWESPVIDGYIVFPTFDPTPGVVAEHNVPNQCGSDPPPEGEEGGETPEVVCSTSGLGRTYKLWYQCGLGEYSESDTPISGVETYTDGSTTKAYYPPIDPVPPPEDEWEHPGNHTVTNWRQY